MYLFIDYLTTVDSCLLAYRAISIICCNLRKYEKCKLQNEELNDLYSSPIIVWVIKPRRIRWTGHVAQYGRQERCIQGFGGLNLRERDHLGDPGIDGRIILRWIFRKWDVGVGIGSSWLRVGTGGRHLWMQLWTFGFHKMQGISWLAANCLASQGLCSME